MTCLNRYDHSRDSLLMVNNFHDQIARPIIDIARNMGAHNGIFCQCAATKPQDSWGISTTNLRP
ncbi:hypothetical protein ASPFODRAFT_326423 [Aspergillus luchuensis CBS 106.47]|uniref:Uncharacterized protein n=1 Tax=Aspergillus luchuensis (strain CBS 106.47) TaxID=1137211 RepID=A0A1M3T6Z5_ASPLC|nr:hypothetical protein ASPFODRAFT_326423 [Aspergillus luchuensis CBS 106.47]